MQVVVNHLTRMSAPRICVAGLDVDGARHVRPITRRADPLTRDHLTSAGGPFDLGAVIDLGRVKPNPDPPETEDHWFSPAGARRVSRLDPDEYLELLEDRCHDDLEAIFGPALHRTDWSYAVDPGEGDASLGCLRVRRRPDLDINKYGKLRLRLNDPEKPAFLPVTDLRLVEPDHKTLCVDAINDARERMRRGVRARLMLGLARAYQAGRDDRKRHWLQVNGLCFEDRPLGGRP
ncbi:MAG: hypothetical protein M3433_03345 [Actinomycetota bacterium]|nr:hypothetical protein [Actinomycetota bacterium]